MKIFKLILSLALLICVSACKNNTTPEVKTISHTTTSIESKKTLDPNAEYVKAEFNIEGMTCAVGCAATIQKKLAKMDGVKHAVVNFDKQLAMVEYDKAIVTPSTLKNTVTGVAPVYKVKDMKTVKVFSKN